ncbi:MAG: uncharacterized protein KVP18_001663 [Porospora cf. gigantea A]|uniref:uncharacterized protein n=1 Tax=Porospora cf. gigantea A TaxID=2853593 RepID=UPI00355997EB|nr:MAG: hypothetical protein KVP18_001663 [Porospora cf. gigantea A]
MDLNIITNPEVRSRIEEWVRIDWRQQSELSELLKDYAANEEELKARFIGDLEFGTAGLRGRMATVGFNRMNQVTVLQATQGICAYLQERFTSDDASSRGVVVGFDGRHNSKSFAHHVAAVFLAKGFKVFLFGDVTATPLTPYVVQKKRCLVGIQVTASHNPKDDNGYKVYAANGAQIIPPMDREVASLIRANQKMWDGVGELLDASGFLKNTAATTNLYDYCMSEYFTDMASELLLEPQRLQAAKDTQLKVVYTAMHGVGYPWVEKVVEVCGFPKAQFYAVKEQQWPDPEFSTVAFPNPEEKGALDLAMALAESKGARVVVANDPDADRFACAEQHADGRWHVFHGDELGSLFGHFGLQREIENGAKPEDLLFICSAVSSRMLQKIAESNGAKFLETMTGFKWMMNCALEHTPALKPVLVYEEALGYANWIGCPDKDGVSATGMWLQEAARIYNNGGTLLGKLQELRRKYGYFVTNNSYFLCYDKNAINQLFTAFRNDGKYAEKIGRFPISRIRDCTTGYDNGEPNNKCTFPLTPTANMITLFFANGCVLTVRTSGTEPKLKWYAELSKPQEEEARQEVDELVQSFVSEVLKPNVYPLHAPGAMC